MYIQCQLYTRQHDYTRCLRHVPYSATPNCLKPSFDYTKLYNFPAVLFIVKFQKVS